MRKHYNISVAGRVQGVFFRASTKTSADRLNIKGFVRNERDGSVYIEAEGEEDNLEKFIEWCKQGSSGAEVQSFDARVGDVKGYTEFLIVR
jgi:acylphosphatase